MFSFFRRSKKSKQSDLNSSKENEEKRNKEKDHFNQDSGSSTPNNQNDSCKNNFPTEIPENALQGGQVVSPSFATESGLIETDSSAPVSSVNIVSSTNENNETEETNSDVQEGLSCNTEMDKPDVTNKEKTKQPNAQPLTYASMLRKVEPIKITNSVKPCGHGTIAITPRIPLPTGVRRDSVGTPPDSPKFIQSRKNSTNTLLESTENNFSFTSKTTDVSTGDASKPDVVNDAVKVAISLPILSSLSANSATKKANVFGEEDIKYV